MKEYEKRITNAETIDEVKAIINEAEYDKNISDEDWQTLWDYSEERQDEILNESEIEYPEYEHEYDVFDDMWHSGEFE